MPKANIETMRDGKLQTRRLTVQPGHTSNSSEYHQDTNQSAYSKASKAWNPVRQSNTHRSGVDSQPDFVEPTRDVFVRQTASGRAPQPEEPEEE